MKPKLANITKSELFLGRYGTGDPRRGSSDGRSPRNKLEKYLGIFETSDLKKATNVPTERRVKLLVLYILIK